MKNEKKELIFDIQELDRRRIARDLHDTSLQNLAHLVHKLELAFKYVDVDPVQAKLIIAVVQQNINLIIEEIRNTIFNLRPMMLDDLDLKNSISWLLDKQKENSEMKIVSEIDILFKKESDSVELFRIIQECVGNACKHSQGSCVTISLKKRKDAVVLHIKDDGIGFDLEQKKEKHFGLLIIKERAKALSGSCKIMSAPNQGTEIEIKIPVENVK